LQVPIPNPPDS